MGKQSDETTTVILRKEVKLLENPLSCLSANKDVRHLVVGGRNIFKIFDCQNQEFEEVTNLRSGTSSSNQSLGVNDVNWCKTDEKLLVSASNNGAVVVWDINNNGQAVQEYVMKDQQRTINCLEYFSDSSNMILAASQDGSCKCIDIRKREIPVIYGPSIESPAREVQFDPRNSNQFAVVFENGSCQVWDIRNSSNFERQWVAHIGTSVCLDWHPVENWLVTGGRDKTAAVWDFSAKSNSTSSAPSSMVYKYSAETVASIGKVKWRPNHKYQVLTTPMLTETYASVWDVRRPFIPEVFFVEHKDFIGGVVWKDEDIFYTCGRDHKLCRFVYADHSHLKESLNPVCISFGIYGNILHAAHDKLIITTSTTTPMQQCPPPDDDADDGGGDDDGGGVGSDDDGGEDGDGGERRERDQGNDDEEENDDRILTQNSITVEYQTSTDEFLSMDPFLKMAREYKLEGNSFKQLCQHNAAVAMLAGRDIISTSWSMIGLMFEPEDAIGRDSANKKLSRVENKTVVFPDSSRSDEGMKVSTFASMANDSDSEYDSVLKNNPYFDNFRTRNFLKSFDDVCMKERSNSTSDDEPQVYLEPDLNFHLNYEEYDPTGSKLEQLFRHHVDMFGDETSSDSSGGGDCGGGSGGVYSSGSKSKSRRMELEEAIKKEILNTEPCLATMKKFDYTEIAVDMLNMFAEQNDVQSAVSMSLVLGHRVMGSLDPNIFHFWLSSYIDMLNRFELYIISTEIQNLYQPDQPQMSTHFKINCSQCQRVMKYGWVCRKCPKNNRNNLIHLCSICHLPVKSLYIWCQGCSHGGHVRHMMNWFSGHRDCPTGCGHICEYS